MGITEEVKCMENRRIMDKITNLQEQIESLPKGSICTKNIKGNTYYYHRYSTNNKRIEKYIDSSLVGEFKSKISLRKDLEHQLKILKKDLDDKRKVLVKNEGFE